MYDFFFFFSPHIRRWQEEAWEREFLSSGLAADVSVLPVLAWSRTVSTVTMSHGNDGKV